MQMNSNGPIQRSATQWGEILARYRQSGMGSRQFCEEEGRALRTFEKWQRRMRRSETSKGQFVEVTPTRGKPGLWAVEVEFPTGVRLRVRG
jgi:hypothetical protein